MSNQPNELVLKRSEQANALVNREPRSASLSDLIQLECVSGAREAVLVTSNGRQGHLFFEGGAMIHARVDDLLGDEAAFEIVSWRSGTFSASDLPWPLHASITISWQELLAEAARASDEHARVRSARVPARSTTLRSSVPLFESVVAPNPSERAAKNRPSTPPRGRPVSGSAPIIRRQLAPPPLAPRASFAAATGAVKRAARLDDKGALLAVRGDADGLAEEAAAIRLAVLALGDALGLQAFRSFECSCAGRQLMLYRDTKHSYIALEAAPGTNLKAIRPAPSKHQL